MRRLLLLSRYGPKVALLLALTLVCGTSAFATDITVWDSLGTNPGVGNSGENNETEPGTVSSGVEPWDLEGFLFDSTTNTLSLVGEFPFATGILHGGNTYVSGDIFLAVNPTTGLGGVVAAPNADGSDYNYVIDITLNDDYTTGLNGAGPTYTYNVYSLSGLTTSTGLLTTSGGPNLNTNPYRYDYGGTFVTSGTFTLTSYANATALNTALGTTYTDSLVGNDHYVLSGFDLNFLPSSVTSIFTHYTYECGNDLVTGYVTGYTPNVPVPEPASMLVLGIGLLSVAAAKRGLKRS